MGIGSEGIVTPPSQPKQQEDAQQDKKVLSKEHSESTKKRKVDDDGGMMTCARYGGGAPPVYRDEQGTVVGSVLGTSELKRLPGRGRMTCRERASVLPSPRTQVQTATKKRRAPYGTKKRRTPSPAQQSKRG